MYGVLGYGTSKARACVPARVAPLHADAGGSPSGPCPLVQIVPCVRRREAAFFSNTKDGELLETKCNIFFTRRR